MSKQQTPDEYFQQIMNEAAEIADAENGIPDLVISRLIASLPVEAKRAMASAIGITASMALLSEHKRFYVYNTDANQYLMIRVLDEADLPQDLHGELVNFGDGASAGFVLDGARIDVDGATSFRGGACEMCGEQNCTQPACAERRRVLNAVRGMGKAKPMENLPTQEYPS